MKYLALWTFDGKKLEKVLKKSEKYYKNREKTPDKYPKILYPSQATLGSYGGFTVIEATHEQLMNYAQAYGPLMDFEFIPVMDASEVSASSMESKE
jgi:hypothetical protein